jgi:hypothetical protein
MRSQSALGELVEHLLVAFDRLSELPLGPSRLLGRQRSSGAGALLAAF